MSRYWILALAMVWGTPALRAQEVRTAVVPPTSAVGDVFHAAIRVQLEAGDTVVFPDTLPVPADMESAGRRELHVDTLPDGQRRLTAVYPLTAWRTGRLQLTTTAISVRDSAGERGVEVSFSPVDITSVLPADTAGIRPRPAKDVLGANRLVWPLVAGALLLLALLLAGYWLYRRRRPLAVAPAVATTSPQELALAALDRARAMGLLEAGKYKEFYVLVSDAVRHFMAALDARWGGDLTTTELVGRVRVMAGPTRAAELASILGTADLVKFARLQPAQERALHDWTNAREWVSELVWPPAEQQQAKAA